MPRRFLRGTLRQRFCPTSQNIVLCAYFDVAAPFELKKAEINYSKTRTDNKLKHAKKSKKTKKDVTNGRTKRLKNEGSEKLKS